MGWSEVFGGTVKVQQQEPGPWPVAGTEPSVGTICFHGLSPRDGSLPDAVEALRQYEGNGLIILRTQDSRAALRTLIERIEPMIRRVDHSSCTIETVSGDRVVILRESDTERARGMEFAWVLTDGADPGDALLRLRPPRFRMYGSDFVPIAVDEVEPADIQAEKDRAALMAAGYIDRTDIVARRRYPNAPTFNGGSLHDLRVKAEALGFGAVKWPEIKPKFDPTLAPDEWRMSTPVDEVVYHQHAVIHSDPGAVAALMAGFKRMTESAKSLGGAMGGMSSVLDKVHATVLAAKAKRTVTAKLTRIAERSRDTMKREAARVELLARMAPAPLPAMRDEWDQLPDAEPDGIVRRP